MMVQFFGGRIAASLFPSIESSQLCLPPFQARLKMVDEPKPFPELRQGLWPSAPSFPTCDVGLGPHLLLVHSLAAYVYITKYMDCQLSCTEVLCSITLDPAFLSSNFCRQFMPH